MSSRNFYVSTILLTGSIFVLLILLSNDIETNPGSPLSNLSELSVCLYDVITLSETLLSNTSTHGINVLGFHQVVRRDRKSFGRGVAVYIREIITFKRLLKYEHDELEMI